MQAQYEAHLFVEPTDVSLDELFSDSVRSKLSLHVRDGAVPLIRCKDRVTREDSVTLLQLFLATLSFSPLSTSECQESDKHWIDDTDLPQKFSGQAVRYASEAHGQQLPKRRNHSHVPPSSLVEFLADAKPLKCKALIDVYFPLGEGQSRSIFSDAWQKLDEQKGELNFLHTKFQL